MNVEGFFLSTKCHLRCFSSNKQFLYYHIRYINILSLSLSIFTACFKTNFFTQVTEASIYFSKITLRIFKITLSLFRSNLASPVNHSLIASLKQEMPSFEWLPELICSSTENTTWKKRNLTINHQHHKNLSHIRNAILGKDLDTCLQFGRLWLTRKEGDLTAKVHYKRKK